jgi:hypothetical protein
MKKQWLCKLIGHQIDKSPIKYQEEILYRYCSRCGASVYHDNCDFYPEWHYPPLRWVMQLRDRFIIWQARRNHKITPAPSDDEIPF